MRLRQHIGNVEYEEKIFEEIRDKAIQEERERLLSDHMNNERYHDILLALPVLKEYGLI